MSQTYTSAGTSVNSGRLPAVYRKMPRIGGRTILDIGCGKYVEHIRSALYRYEYLPYDPYNQPDDVNNETIYRLLRAIRSGTPVDVVCSNVLNVIDDDATLSDIAEWIRSTIKATGGTGYVTVYEGNRSGTGRQTGPDQYQRNQPLREYLRLFPGAVIRSGMIIVT